ncbi:YihY/virulence factor BrkB family protein [Caenispirillum bisanense]|uniref:Membrane protein n=1 Tax=Caenispirillum bisanense TaxID=414052 RepID=A0A286G3P8_9PROT|nr:YihY/virulence factor BrkB family protein [Caenispirillum bisanense]SOD90161.1 membrane protein [Caenispirillum bisanense]
MIGGTVLRIVKRAVAAFIEDRAMSKGAAIAFYTTFSLAPVLFLVVTVASLFLREETARGGVIDAVRQVVGDTGAQAAAGMLEQAYAGGSGTLATLASIVVLVIAATTVFAELQDSLNLIWKAKPSPRWMVWDLVRIRLLSLSLIVVLGFLLLVSLVVSMALAAVAAKIQGPGGFAVVAQAVNLAVSYLVITAMFAVTYRVLPDRTVAWREVLVGAVTTALLFSIGKGLIGLYIGSRDIGTTFGAGSALVVVLIWVYFSSQIFLFGAEIAKAYGETRGSFAAPVADADPAP